MQSRANAPTQLGDEFAGSAARSKTDDITGTDEPTLVRKSSCQ
jgi:hypothetical protein